MRIELTDDERTLTIETIESSTYPGVHARIVADLLDKLRAVKKPKKETKK